MNLHLDGLAGLAWSQLVQVTAVALVAGALVRLLCRHRPHLAYVLWLLVLIKCLTPPIWSSPTGVFSWARAGSPAARPTDPPAELQSSPLAAVVLARSEARPAMVEPSVTAAVNSSPSSPPQRIDLQTALWAIWLFGALAYGGVCVGRGLAWHISLKRSYAPADPALAARSADLAGRIGLRHAVRLVITTTPIGPALYGLWRPTIVLPERMLRAADPRQIESVLAHELIHLRRRDTAVAMLQCFAQALWWFHPLVWWANRGLCCERERCCDEEVLCTLAIEPAVYAQSLLDIVKLKRQWPPLVAFPGMAQVGVTAERLEGIMKGVEHLHRRTPAWCWVVLLAAAALVLPGRAWITGTAAADQAAKEPASPAAPAIAEKLVSTDAAAADQHQPAVEDAFLVLPIRTELQRLKKPCQNASVYVLVNGDAFNKDGKMLDAERFNPARLYKDLLPYKNEGKSSVYFDIRYTEATKQFYVHYQATPKGKVYNLSTSPPGEPEEFRPDYVPPVLLFALEGLGRRVGFRDSVAGGGIALTDAVPPWPAIVAELKKDVGNAAVDESGIGDDLVKAYPVRTALSRHMFHGADCVIHVVPPLNDIAKRQVSEIPGAIERYVEKLRLDRKDTLLLATSFRQPQTPGGAEKALEELRVSEGMKEWTEFTNNLASDWRGGKKPFGFRTFTMESIDR